jgi:C-terminal processing protease CtpA/Prc
MNMKKLLIPILILFLFQACDKNDPAPATAPNDNVDTWIYDNMKYWYYWTDDIPANPDSTLEPGAFFESLLSDEDRFSWIQPDFTELLNSLHGVNKEAGFEFALYRESTDNNDVVMQVLYVKPNSPATSAGLKRGDVIHQINGTQITVDNYSDLLDQLSENHSLTYQALDVENQTLAEAQTINIVPAEYAEDPNFLNKVFEYGDRKIGYYVYNLFSEGPDETSDTYNDEMDNIFGSFKSQGITDLILDLRFNSGGAESAAQNLASYIAPNVTSTTIFVTHEYNKEVTNDIKNDPNLGDGFLHVPFLEKSENISSQLRDNRVYILTGSRTASASELIINGLKPFMDVYLIGGVTVGKNVGSITIFDEQDNSNTWGMQPIVTKLFNKDGQSDYAKGFQPQILDEDNSLYIYPLGDPRETLLSRAIHEISGVSLPARTAAAAKAGDLLFHSLDMKKRSGIVTVDRPF